VNIKGRTHDVHARLLTGDERTATWPTLVKTWPAYDGYQARTSRELRVFRLTPR
jgi:deazaflavin-dependent oxidoreductase (nitroreductase family)